jgi:hypothetical protein
LYKPRESTGDGNEEMKVFPFVFIYDDDGDDDDDIDMMTTMTQKLH